MRFTFTHPMHSHPYNPELVDGRGVAAVAVAAEAAGFSGFGFTDHPAPTQKWLQNGGHDTLDPFVAMGFAAAHTTTPQALADALVEAALAAPFDDTRDNATAVVLRVHDTR